MRGKHESTFSERDWSNKNKLYILLKSDQNGRCQNCFLCDWLWKVW